MTIRTKGLEKNTVAYEQLSGKGPIRPQALSQRDFDTVLAPCAELVRSFGVRLHRTGGVVIREEPITIRRSLAPESDRTDVVGPGGGHFACQRSSFGDS